MNVIFLDFDGVIDTIHGCEKEDVERRIKVLSDICKTYNCKVVVEASSKGFINEETLEVEGEWLETIFTLFKKYEIECIGRTPSVIKKLGDDTYLPMWKEDEIRLYLFNHPEIDHYCIIDDDDLTDLHRKSDLDKVRNHLVKTKDFLIDNPKEEGLQIYHKEEVGKILELENDLKKFAAKKKVK